jgi:hypothetical protein
MCHYICIRGQSDIQENAQFMRELLIDHLFGIKVTSNPLFRDIWDMVAGLLTFIKLELIMS